MATRRVVDRSWDIDRGTWLLLKLEGGSANCFVVSVVAQVAPVVMPDTERDIYASQNIKLRDAVRRQEMVGSFQNWR